MHFTSEYTFDHFIFKNLKTPNINVLHIVKFLKLKLSIVRVSSTHIQPPRRSERWREVGMQCALQNMRRIEYF